MRKRWRAILCLWGLILFGLLTFSSMRVDRYLQQQHYQGRYFWWGSIGFDPDPLNKHPVLKPCAQEDDSCGPQYIRMSPSLIDRALTFSALPALLLGLAFVRGLAHFGVSELLSFMITMPLLILAWFYTVGWFLDRWQHKRS